MEHAKRLLDDEYVDKQAHTHTPCRRKKVAKSTSIYIKGMLLLCVWDFSTLSSSSLSSCQSPGLAVSTISTSSMHIWSNLIKRDRTETHADSVRLQRESDDHRLIDLMLGSDRSLCSMLNMWKEGAVQLATKMSHLVEANFQLIKFNPFRYGRQRAQPTRRN